MWWHRRRRYAVLTLAAWERVEATAAHLQVDPNIALDALVRALPYPEHLAAAQQVLGEDRTAGVHK